MDDFGGLYTEFALPAKPFLRLGKNLKTYIVTQTAEGSRTTIVLIDAESPSNVKRVTSAKNDSVEDALWSWNFLGTDGHAQFLCARSSPIRPNELLLGTVDDHLTVIWKVLDAPVLPSAVEQALKSLQASIIQVPDRHPVETILVKESKGISAELKPLATFIHGGPHSTSFTAFTPSVAALALQGYNVSLPNYTGSLGFGEYYVQKLLGKCGSLDVEDMGGKCCPSEYYGGF
ncbi:hypothetical protein EWM64_g10840 [Hericium alpestre]|uniref:Peptidase S9 prolyl oligopeptidase catalytic domain-containing protein n=1 Tax=Hericium alpestre TaxID=135208 RepID=A0A4Y9ZF03_9AGAM|nr:hypothetical protein EWM64_g10840 [Hericium alpestre]